MQCLQATGPDDIPYILLPVPDFSFNLQSRRVCGVRIPGEGHGEDALFRSAVDFDLNGISRAVFEKTVIEGAVLRDGIVTDANNDVIDLESCLFCRPA